MMDDTGLLSRFLDGNSEDAFRTLVERHSAMVYSACLRGLDGRTDLAEDATQAVFVILARKAKAVRNGRALGWWLFRAANSVVAHMRREESRRRRREAEAAARAERERAMVDEESLWDDVKGRLNDAVASLRAAQQVPVVLHFLEGKALGEVAREIGCSEDAARKRIAYGLEKMRAYLSRKGAVMSVAALSSLIEANAMQAPPPGLVEACGAAAGAGAAAGPGTVIAKGAMKMMMLAKVKVLAATAALVLAAAVPAVHFGLRAARSGEADKAPAADAPGKPKQYPYRWLFTHVDFDKEASVSEVKKAIETAAASGFNGVALKGSWVIMSKWPKEDMDRLAGLKAFCDEKKMDLIPAMVCPGSGWQELRFDKNLVEGQPVRDVLFEVKGNEANVVPETPLSAVDGDFENAEGDKAKGFCFQSAPGKKTFIDREVAKQGKASLRFESEPGWTDVSVKPFKPWRHYVVRLWAKASVPKPAGKIFIQVRADKGEPCKGLLSLKDGNEWQKIEWSFCTMDFKDVTVNFGVAGTKDSKGEKFWIDCAEVFEPGMVNLLRRPGTPVVVKKDGSDEALKAGVDYEDPVPKSQNFREACPAPASLKIIPGGKIVDGDKLRVSYYTYPSERWGNDAVCLSEPKTNEIWRDAFRLVNDAIKPRKWLLDMDEIRGGGTCGACRDRKNADGSPMTPGQILGDCVTRQTKAIREVCPDAEIAIWSDLFDPNHSCTEFYFTVPGGYVGSWDYIPKDLVICCWYLDKAEKSLAHFSGKGFRTLAAGYYDADDLSGDKKWLEYLDKTPKAVGIMYTTWERKYKLLGPFGELVNRK